MASKFETIGMELLDECITPREARRSFRYSCRCCCYHGMHINCDECEIQKHLSRVLAAFASVQRPQQKALPGGSV